MTQSKMRLCSICLLFASILQLGGCGYGSVYNVVKPTDVTVDQALADVGRGLGNMKREMRAGGIENAGLLVDDVTVTLSVTADAQRTGKLVLDASSPIELGAGAGSAKANAEATSSDKANRTNQITIKLKNWYTAQLNEQGKKESGRPGTLIDPPE